MADRCIYFWCSLSGLQGGLWYIEQKAKDILCLSPICHRADSTFKIIISDKLYNIRISCIGQAWLQFPLVLCVRTHSAKNKCTRRHTYCRYMAKQGQQSYKQAYKHTVCGWRKHNTVRKPTQTCVRNGNSTQKLNTNWWVIGMKYTAIQE